MGWLRRLLTGEAENAKAIPFDTNDPAQRVLPDPYEPFTGFYSGSIPVADPGVPLARLQKANVDAIWRSQPNVRKVVDFVARNVASIPLHTFERVSDTDRRRLTEHPLADVIAHPQPRIAPFRFWHSVLSDGLLYDRWAVLKQPTPAGGLTLVQIPSWRLRLATDALRRVSGAWYWVGDIERPQDGDRDGWRPLDLDMLIFDHGYAPTTAGLSPMETLADVLAETEQAVKYRRQVWANGARVPAWIERPPPPPHATADWSPEARERFKKGFRAAYTGDGTQAGGVPLLEDGMKLHESKAFSPVDTQDLEGRRLSSIEVAAAFHIAPELVGAREGTYSNVDAFRQMLYRDSLGPYITAWEGTLNAQLVPDLAGSRRLYVEANVDSKLRGSFQEQAQVMQSATGAPWLTRNEARALQNRPPIDGGDEVVVPLNVLVGGQASPRDGITAGRGGGSLAPAQAEPEAPSVGGFTPAEIVQLVGAAATLIRSGFAPEAALVAVGLDPIEHLGLLPVTVQRPQVVENPDEEIEEALKAARSVRQRADSRSKAAAPSTHEQKAEQVIAEFFRRQGRAVRSRVGAGRDDWWAAERWDTELAAEVAGLYLLTATEAGRATLETLGVEPDEYDEPRTQAFLVEAARRSAKQINATTLAEVQAALDASDADDDEAPSPTEAVGHVFEIAEESRATQVALTVTAFAAGFGSVEAARQQAPGATKTWHVNSGNPRPSHAAMDGETVGIDEDFSNGLPWPGAAGSDADESAGCQCSVTINIP